MTIPDLIREPDGTGWVNRSGLPAETVRMTVQEVGRELARWMDGVRAAGQRPVMFDRTGYAAPDNPYQQMVVAKRAVDYDDIVSATADITEGLALQGVKWESEEPDDADVFNQISRDLNLDDVVRTWHREEFTYSQVIVGMWWGRKQYKVRGYNVLRPEMNEVSEVDEFGLETKSLQPEIDKTTGKPVKPKKVKRKKVYDIEVPLALTFLDPTKIVPIGSAPFGVDRIAWHADKADMAALEEVEKGIRVDPMMSAFFLGRYEPGREEAERLQKLGVDSKRLIELNPKYVFRHCVTKPDYQRFPNLRLKSVFTLLDLKQHLIESDRVALIGAANYILLVKKGTKEDPASQEEVDNLQENFQVVAKVPVIVSDHRLEIEIITPAQDHVLQAEKYDTLDRRILARTLGSLTFSSSGQRNESTLTAARSIGRLLETRRLMMKRTLERRIAEAIVEANEGKFEDSPNLTFTPRNIQLDSEAQVVQAILALRTQNELSRESILDFFGFDQKVEAQRREYEEESGLDDIFQTQVPFASPEMGGGKPVPPQVSGGQGGRPVGGGKTPQSPQAQTKPKTPAGNPSTKKE